MTAIRSQPTEQFTFIATRPPENNGDLQAGSWWRDSSRSSNEDSRIPGKQFKVIAYVSCPSCKQVCMLGQGFHRVTHSGIVFPVFRCPNYPACSFERRCKLDDWTTDPNKRLFAIAVRRLTLIDGQKQWRIAYPLRYTHDVSADFAKRKYAVTMPANEQIIAVGEAIGFFVDDTKGEKLSVDLSMPALTAKG